MASKKPHPDSDSGSQPSSPLPLPTSPPPQAWHLALGSTESLFLNSEHTCPQPAPSEGQCAPHSSPAPCPAPSMVMLQTGGLLTSTQRAERAQPMFLYFNSFN